MANLVASTNKPQSMQLHKQNVEFVPPPQHLPKLDPSDNISDNFTPVDQKEIEIEFDTLKRIQLSSEISIAYSEIIDGFKNSELNYEDLQEVLASYSLNPFDHIQIS